MVLSEVVVTTGLIFAARVVDVSLGTLRTMFVVRGLRGRAWAIGFVEILVWVVAVSRVLHNLDYPAYAIAYALGFATGNFVGVTIEQRLAMGDRVVRVFTRRGDEMATRLRAEGFGVTVFEGRGKDGPVELLYIEVQRRRVSGVRAIARAVDPACFYVIDEVREASSAQDEAPRPSGRHER